MPADIYGANPAPKESRRKNQAISQRRDEYLRATGGEAVHQRHRHHHQHQHQHRERHRRFPRWKAVLLGLGVLVLAIAGLVWWMMGDP